MLISSCSNDLMLFISRLEPVQLVFVIIGASMGALGLMILFVGCLATGATRHKVYRTWGGRVGGRVSCAVVSTSYVFTHSVDNNDDSFHNMYFIFMFAVHGYYICPSSCMAFNAMLFGCCDHCVHHILGIVFKSSSCCGAPLY